MPTKESANIQNRMIERDISAVTLRLDRHLEIYAQNGKELAALRVSVDNLGRVIEKGSTAYEVDQVVLRQEFKLHENKVNVMENALSTLATKIGVYATVGSASASVAVGVILRVFF